MSELDPQLTSLLDEARRDPLRMDDDARRALKASTLAAVMLSASAGSAVAAGAATAPTATAAVTASLGGAGVKWLVIGALSLGALGAGTAAVRAHRASETSALGAEALVPEPQPTPNEAAPERMPAMPQSTLEPAAGVAPKPAKIPAARDANAPTGEPSLSDEIRQLQEAQSKVNAGDATGALRALDAYDRSFAHGQLRSESAAVRIFALCSLGRINEAKRLSKTFLSREPSGPLADRVRASCTDK